MLYFFYLRHYWIAYFTVVFYYFYHCSKFSLLVTFNLFSYKNAFGDFYSFQGILFIQKILKTGNVTCFKDQVKTVDRGEYPNQTTAIFSVHQRNMRSSDILKEISVLYINLFLELFIDCVLIGSITCLNQSFCFLE